MAIHSGQCATATICTQTGEVFTLPCVRFSMQMRIDEDERRLWLAHPLPGPPPDPIVEVSLVCRESDIVMVPAIGTEETQSLRAKIAELEEELAAFRAGHAPIPISAIDDAIRRVKFNAEGGFSDN
jgi:hypothetical protein